jgi:hypothetical protein
MAGVSEERLALNEAAFRKVNEGIEAGSDDHRMVFACECGRLGCNQLLELSRFEYDAVREHPRRFFVLAGHELPDIERVVERHHDYLVVEKVGPAGYVAERTDPRQDDDPE